MNNLHSASKIIIGFCLTLCVSYPVTSKTDDFSAFEGAWVKPGVSCAEIFTWGKQGTSFRKPLRLDVPALIVTRKSITTAKALCRIRSTSPSQDGRMFSLTCSTPLNFSPMKEVLSIAADGALLRHSDSNDRIGTRFERCRP
jgi:hypothetical protein